MQRAERLVPLWVVHSAASTVEPRAAPLVVTLVDRWAVQWATPMVGTLDLQMAESSAAPSAVQWAVDSGHRWAGRTESQMAAPTVASLAVMLVARSVASLAAQRAA